jgi:GNAT superfamily N-acetyltransferase
MYRHLSLVTIIKTSLLRFPKPKVNINKFILKDAGPEHKDRFIIYGRKNNKILLLYDPKLDTKQEIGYITIELERPEIGLIWLDKPWRGYGIGKQLLDIGIDEIKKNDKNLNNEVHIFSTRKHPFFYKLKGRRWQYPHHMININNYEYLKIDENTSV